MDKPGLYLYIKADVNDGDYITEMHEINNEFSEKHSVADLVPILEKLARIESLYDDEIETQFTEEEWDKIEGLMPYPTQCDESIHTITQVSIININNVKTY